jgi:hypothetical protein
MGRLIDLSGQKFGRLLVVDISHRIRQNGKTVIHWNCICDCSNKPCVVKGHSLRRGNTRSCGCLGEENRAVAGHKNFIDLTGQSFGNLTVIELDHMNNRGAYWKCQCDCEDKNVVVCAAHDMKTGKITSCGCLRHGIYGESSFNKLLDNYMRNAKKRNLIFEITKDEFKKIIGENCYYCGRQPNQVFKNNKATYGEYLYNGIDRIDNSVGYIAGNIVACCKFCNHTKSNYTKEYFIQYIENIYNNLKNKGVIKITDGSQNIS